GASGQLAVSVLSQPVPAMPMARARTLRPVVVRSRNMTVLRPLEDRGDAHAAGGADRDQPTTGAFLFQQLRQRRHDARAGGGKRMADGEARSVHVDPGRIDRTERRIEAEPAPAI